MVEPGSVLLTDLYQLTMLGGYVREGIAEREAVFDLGFRTLPFGGGFAVAAGLEPALRHLSALHLSAEDLRYLEGLGILPERALVYLAGLRFTGDVDAIPEGTPVFPGEPLVRIRAPLAQAQIIETAMLAIINYQTLVATKAARIRLAAGEAKVLEFGLRRAQGLDGGLAGARAAIAGGCDGTSNVLAGRLFGVPVAGTMAHSWVLGFPSEIEAFGAYARVYPDACLLLIDTFDTLESGLPNAIAVAREIEAAGHRFAGVRIDSGDLARISRETRRRLDEAGLAGAKIVASGDLDEHRIEFLRAAGAPIDVFGVGTRLTAAWDEPALSGVYKLAAIADADGTLRPCAKRSDAPQKSTLPGVKNVIRRRDPEGIASGDAIILEEEVGGEGLLEPAMRGGRIVCPLPPVLSIRDRARAALAAFPPDVTRIRDPDPYPVEIGSAVEALRRSLIGT
ncbi:MAG: nicotinate phosphoribosyltransferase [Planctomycetes bacterium]|nr:nicotinate phosphoribosyltransferase [Planctomycetota bacterium]